MKISKTLLFMFRNPIPFIVQLICWFLYAVSSVAPEGAFIRDPWSRVLRLIKTSLSDLPGSLENFAIIVSILFDEVIMEVMRDGGWIFVVLFAFIIGYREAKGNLKGIAKERQTWIQWYGRQEEVIRGNDPLGEPPSKLENTQANSYFRKAEKTVFSMVRHPMRFVLHFTCWFLPFFLLLLIDWSYVIETAGDLVKIVPFFVTFVAIPAFLTSYQETRGTVKGIAKETQVWTKWYQRQINATAQGYALAAPPPSLEIS